MPSDPQITIVTPVLNQVETIAACIRSVAAQPIPVQHIVIDGRSSDGTIDVIREYEYELAHWVSETDHGQSHAINKGLSMAKGTFFNWLNADDQLVEGALGNVADHMTPDIQAIIGKCRHVDSDGRSLDIGGARLWDSVEATIGNYSMGQPSLFYRTSVLKDLGGLNEQLHLCMDMDLWFRFLLQNGRSNIVETDEVLSRFLVHERSKTGQHGLQMQREKYGIYRALLRNSKLPEVLGRFFQDLPIPGSVAYDLPTGFNQKKLLANFAWHLLVKAYADKDLDQCRALFDVVNQGKRLDQVEKIKWRARLNMAKRLAE